MSKVRLGKFCETCHNFDVGMTVLTDLMSGFHSSCCLLTNSLKAQFHFLFMQEITVG